MKPMFRPVTYWEEAGPGMYRSNTGEVEVTFLPCGVGISPHVKGPGWFCKIPGYRHRRALRGWKGPFDSKEEAMAQVDLGMGNAPFIRKGG